MAVIEIKNTADFHEQVRRCGKRVTLFRGEPGVFPLKPKLARYNKDQMARAIEAEAKILDDFMKMARPFLDRSAPADPWEWLALAQHHGLRTRFLDWTENPLVAAYFAVHDKFVGDAVIYALDERSLREPRKVASPFKIRKPYLYRPQHITPRITSQAGVLIAQHDLTREFRCEGLEKWVVTENCLVELDSQLYQYGFHAASIFPGLDSIAKHVMTRWMGD